MVFVGYENVSPHFENIIKEVSFNFFNINPYNVPISEVY